MRIGIDLLAAQSPHHGRRGIGRYARGLVSGLLARSAIDGDTYVLYRRDSLIDPGLDVPADANVIWRVLSDDGRSEAAPDGDRLVRENPDDLDAFLVVSPFESWAGYLPPTKRLASDRPVLAAVLYDAIPFLFPCDRYLLHPDTRRLTHSARAVTRFDALFAISESTRQDVINHFDLDATRVTMIGSATDDSLFANPSPLAPFEREELRELGIDRPYVLCVGGMDPRKNFRGLAEAYSKMPEALQRSHCLVLACDIHKASVSDAMNVAKHFGVSDAIVLTGEVSDRTLERLYRGCAVFAFPSIYEGFGLPVLEAMKCGAPVVVANNSSLPEVVGDAGLLAEVSDPAAFGAALARILNDPQLADDLRAKAALQASLFSWSKVAKKARQAIQEAFEFHGNRSRSTQAATRPKLRKTRPRLAMVSPLPPHGSGISDYTANLVEELKHNYRIDLFHDGTYAPLPSLADPDLVAADARLLPRLAAVRDYRAIVYQMGNSRFHQFFYPLMFTHPGIVTLHDFCLAGFHQAYERAKGVRRDHFVTELEYNHGKEYDDILPLLRRGLVATEKVTHACAQRGTWMNRRIFESAEAVIVHSPWCVERAGEQDALLAAKCRIIPMGTTLSVISDERRAAIRERFGFPQDAVLIASFGFVHTDKMNSEAIEAFALVARNEPKAIKLIVGMEADDGAARAAASKAGVTDRVRFLGRRNYADFQDLAAITDVGVSLRRPPTNGETSGALLDILPWGVPTIVTDVATFADYPDSIVAKIRWPQAGIAGLADVMRSLVCDTSRRETLGNAALNHVRQYHQWSSVAEQYAAVIEQSAEQRGRLMMRGAS